MQFKGHISSDGVQSFVNKGYIRYYISGGVFEGGVCRM